MGWDPTPSVRKETFILVSYFSDMKLHVTGRDTVRFDIYLRNSQEKSIWLHVQLVSQILTFWRQNYFF